MRTFWLFFLVGVCGAVSGCSESGMACDCVALPPAITFTVVDANDGGMVSGASVNGVSCSGGCSGHLPDGGLIEQAGRFDFSADAPGYEGLQFEADVPAAPVTGRCCEIPFVPQHVGVPLLPL